jgi:nucleoid-associated protein YgaU
MLLLLVVCVALLVTGCAKKKAIQAVEDLNKAFGDAKDGCASVYAPDDLASVGKDVDEANRLKDDNKWKKALNKAEATSPDVQNLNTVTGQTREQAQRDAKEALGAADAALKEAEAAEASKYGGAYYSEGKAKLEAAKKNANDPCKWAQAATEAKAAEDSLRRARNAAVAEKKRLEEEARMAAEARRRAEEEARRKAEQEAWLKAHPPNYVVQRGDYLWRIAGMSKIYDASKFWPLIYDANRGQINDPDLIYPNQNLTIPREMSDTEMMDKLRDMWSKAAQGEEL